MIALAEWIVSLVVVCLAGYAVLLWFAGVVAPLFAPLDRWLVNRHRKRKA